MHEIGVSVFVIGQSRHGQKNLLRAFDCRLTGLPATITSGSQVSWMAMKTLSSNIHNCTSCDSSFFCSICLFTILLVQLDLVLGREKANLGKWAYLRIQSGMPGVLYVGQVSIPAGQLRSLGRLAGVSLGDRMMSAEVTGLGRLRSAEVTGRVSWGHRAGQPERSGAVSRMTGAGSGGRPSGGAGCRPPHSSARQVAGRRGSHGAPGRGIPAGWLQDIFSRVYRVVSPPPPLSYLCANNTMAISDA